MYENFIDNKKFKIKQGNAKIYLTGCPKKFGGRRGMILLARVYFDVFYICWDPVLHFQFYTVLSILSSYYKFSRNFIVMAVSYSPTTRRDRI